MRVDLRALRSPWAIPPWLVTLWGLINALSNVDFIANHTPKMSTVWQFLLTPAGNLTVIGIGLSWLFGVAVISKPKRTELPMGELTVHVQSDDGDDIESAQITMINHDTGREYETATSWNGTCVHSVPYGEYSVVIVKPGYVRAKHAARVGKNGPGAIECALQENKLPPGFA